MSIGYDNVTVRDAALYFADSSVWHYDASEGKVYPYRLSIGGSGSTSFANATVTMLPIADGEEREVRGRALTSQPEYILHRFPVDYVPVRRGTLLSRVCTEPQNRRAAKGTRPNLFRHLQLANMPEDIHAEANTRRSIHYALAGVQRGRPNGIPSYDTSMQIGIAEVLSIGTPACMARLIDRRDAVKRAKDAVKRMFLNKARKVVVPDFPVAIVKDKKDKHKAYVLLRGHYIGTLHKSKSGLRYIGWSGQVEEGPARDALMRGQESLAMRLFADTVEWDAS